MSLRSSFSSPASRVKRVLAACVLTSVVFTSAGWTVFAKQKPVSLREKNVLRQEATKIERQINSIQSQLSDVLAKQVNAARTALNGSGSTTEEQKAYERLNEWFVSKTSSIVNGVVPSYLTYSLQNWADYDAERRSAIMDAFRAKFPETRTAIGDFMTTTNRIIQTGKNPFFIDATTRTDVESHMLTMQQGLVVAIRAGLGDIMKGGVSQSATGAINIKGKAGTLDINIGRSSSLMSFFTGEQSADIAMNAQFDVSTQELGMDMGRIVGDISLDLGFIQAENAAGIMESFIQVRDVTIAKLASDNADVNTEIQKNLPEFTQMVDKVKGKTLLLNEYDAYPADYITQSMSSSEVGAFFGKIGAFATILETKATMTPLQDLGDGRFVMAPNPDAVRDMMKLANTKTLLEEQTDEMMNNMQMESVTGDTLLIYALGTDTNAVLTIRESDMEKQGVYASVTQNGTKIPTLRVNRAATQDNATTVDIMAGADGVNVSVNVPEKDVAATLAYTTVDGAFDTTIKATTDNTPMQANIRGTITRNNVDLTGTYSVGAESATGSVQGTWLTLKGTSQDGKTYVTTFEFTMPAFAPQVISSIVSSQTSTTEYLPVDVPTPASDGSIKEILNPTEDKDYGTFSTGSVSLDTVQATFATTQSGVYLTGNTSARFGVVEFIDSQCPACTILHHKDTVINRLNTVIGTGAYLYTAKQYPMSYHYNSGDRAVATLCAGKVGGADGYFSYIDGLFAFGKADDVNLSADNFARLAGHIGLDVSKFEDCIKNDTQAMNSLVQADKSLAEAYGLDVIPVVYLVDRTTGKYIKLDGVLTTKTIDTIIKKFSDSLVSKS